MNPKGWKLWHFWRVFNLDQRLLKNPAGNFAAKFSLKFCMVCRAAFLKMLDKTALLCYNISGWGIVKR